MKFIEIFDEDDERICVNTMHILKFKASKHGTHVYLVDGTTLTTSTPFDDFINLV